MSEHIDVMNELEQIRQIESNLAERWFRLRELPADSPSIRTTVLEIIAGGSRCLVPVSAIQEVVEIPWSETMPDAPDWIIGTFHFGNNPVSLVDVGLRMTGTPTPIADELLVIITNQPHWLGLVVNSIGRVFDIEPKNIGSAGPEVPHAPFVIGAVCDESHDMAHLLSTEWLGRACDA